MRALPVTTPLFSAALLLAACGTQAAGGRPAATSRAYDGRCVLAGIDEVPAPVGQAEDSIVMVARYRPSEGGNDDSPLSLRFLVQRARERDLRLHIEAHPNVVCEVDRDATKASPAHVDLPPFEGQTGTVER